MQLAEASRTIEVTLLGQRLKAARVAAGMTQAQLADGEVTAAYVSRIEAGQRRPEAKLLERFSHRLGVTLHVLLDDPSGAQVDALRVRLDHAELAMVSGDATGALATLDELTGPDALTSPSLLRRAQQTRALALEALGRSEEAVALLEELVRRPEADIAWVKSVIALSRCYREAGDYARAIATGEGASELIEELQLAGTTEAIQLTVTIAGAYLQRGDLAHALRLCQQGVADAERVGSPTGKASAYWNASIIESMRGRQVAALELAQKAMVLFEIGEDSRNLGRLRTQLAFVYMQQSPPDAVSAKQSLSLAENELAWSSAGWLDRADYHLAVGKADLLLGDVETAKREAARARDMVEGQAPFLLAECELLLGQVEAAEGDMAAARGHYHQAVAALTGLGIDRDVARLWFDLAGLLEQAGDATGALDAYKRGATATGLADPLARTTDQVAAG